MRKPASWMMIWDDRIPEWAREHESAGAAAMKGTEYFQVSRLPLSRRLSKFNEKGLFQHLGNGVYVIIATGESYLESELSAEELNGENDEEGSASA